MQVALPAVGGKGGGKGGRGSAGGRGRSGQPKASCDKCDIRACNGAPCLVFSDKNISAGNLKAYVNFYRDWVKEKLPNRTATGDLVPSCDLPSSAAARTSSTPATRTARIANAIITPENL